MFEEPDPLAEMVSADESIRVNHGDGLGEQSVTAIETSRGYVSDVYVNHGDGVGERHIWQAEEVVDQPDVGVNTNTASDVTETEARLNGTLTELTNADSADCWFQWRESGTYTWTETDPTTRFSTGSFDSLLTGLETDTTYEYRARASAENESGTDTATGTLYTVTTSEPDPDPDPEISVSTNTASSVTTGSAQLNADLETLTAIDTANLWFEWGVNGTGLPNQTSTQTLSSTGGFNTILDALDAGTSYEFRAHASGEDGDGVEHTDSGSVVTFSTNPSDETLYEYDATDLRLDHGDRISEWDDIGETPTATVSQGTSDHQPLYTSSGIGDNPSVDFTPNEHLISDEFETPLTQPYTIAVVANWDTMDGYAYYGIDTGQRSFIQNNGETFLAWAGNTLESTVDADTNEHVFLAVFDGDDSVIRVDDVETTGNAGTLDHSGMTIGGRHDESQMLDGTVAHLQCYNHRLDQDERDDLAETLTQQWNLDEPDDIDDNVIDDFEDGIHPDWTNGSAYSTGSATAREGVLSAVRTDSGQLTAAGAQDDLLDFGGEFTIYSAYATVDDGSVQLDFMQSGHGGYNGYHLIADWPANELRLEDHSGDVFTTLATDDPILWSDTWYDIVLYYGPEGIRATVYDTDTDDAVGELTSSLSGADSGTTWSWYLENNSASDPNRLDYVRVREEDPYTGEHYSDVEIDDSDDGGNGGSDPSTADYSHSLDSYPPLHSSWETHTIDFVTNPSGSGTVCRTAIEGGTHTGGYFIVDCNDMVGYHPDEVHQRYYIYFGSGTNPGDDCKAPGFSGDNDRDLSGQTEPNGYNGWSARGSYHQDDSVGYYIYHADQPDWWGTYETWSFTFNRSQWYQIDQYVQLNSPGSNDGVIKAWVDGNLVFDSSGWRWRDTSDLGVEGFWHDFYHGGNNTAPSTYYIYTRDYSMWADNGEQM